MRFAPVLLLAGCAAAPRGPAIESYFQVWRTGSFGEKEKASDDVVGRWVEWSASERRSLESAAADSDEEVATRARKAVDRIMMRRRLGRALVAALPEIDEWVLGDSPSAHVHALSAASAAYRRGAAPIDALAELVLIASEGAWRIHRASVIDLTRGSGSSHPYFVLLTRLLEDPNAETRRLALRSITAMRDPTCARLLVARLKDNYPGVRMDAVAALGIIGAIDVLDQIEPLLADENGDVRAAAAAVVGQFGGRKALQPLLEDPHWAARCTAVYALDVMGEPHPDVLLPLLKDRDSGVRSGVLAFIRNLSKPPSVEAVLPLLKDEDSNVRYEAVRTLARIAADHEVKRVGDALKALVRDRDPVLQAIVRVELVRVRGADPGPLIVDRRSEVIDAVAQASDSETWREMRGGFKLCRDVESADDVVAVLKGEGFDVEVPAGTELQGRFPKSSWTTAHELLARLVVAGEHRAIVLGDGRVRVMSRDQAWDELQKKFGE